MCDHDPRFLPDMSFAPLPLPFGSPSPREGSICLFLLPIVSHSVLLLLCLCVHIAFDNLLREIIWNRSWFYFFPSVLTLLKSFFFFFWKKIKSLEALAIWGHLNPSPNTMALRPPKWPWARHPSVRGRLTPSASSPEAELSMVPTPQEDGHRVPRIW